MSDVAKASVLLSAPSSIMNEMYSQFLLDERFHVASVAVVWDDLRARAPGIGAECLLVHADIAPDINSLIDLIGRLKLLVVVILPAKLARDEGMFKNLSNVRSVFIEPVTYSSLPLEAFKYITHERALRTNIEPLRSFDRKSPRSTAVIGTRVMAFWGKGGAGTSTVTSNLAWDLARQGIGTCLIGMSAPDSLAVFFNLDVERTSMAFFQNPSVEGFRDSITKVGTLDVVFSPNNPLAADRISGERSVNDPGSIKNLVLTAASQGYAAVIVDLPSDRSEWSMQALIAANTILLVAHPNFADLQHVVALYRVLTETLRGEHQVASDAIFLVMNGIANSNNLRTVDFHQAAHEFLERPFPPAIAELPLEPSIPLLQNKGDIPALQLDAYRNAIRNLAASLFPNALASVNGHAAPRGNSVIKDVASILGFGNNR